jgi:hypothetical protein
MIQAYLCQSGPISKETSMRDSNTNMTVANIFIDKRIFSS